MKTKLIMVLTCAGLCVPALAFEEREFRSADGTKSFKALPIGYNPKTEVVTVRKTAGAELKFKVAHLSAEDKKFLEENASALEASRKVNLDFDLFNGERETIRTDSERTVKQQAGYEINILNRSKQNINNVEVEYTIFHRKDAENGPGSIAQTKGSLDISTLFAGKEDYNKTDPITLVRYSRQKSGGGWGGAPCKPGGRSVDGLLGMVAKVKVDGKVVKVDATDPQLIAQLDDWVHQT